MSRRLLIGLPLSLLACALLFFALYLDRGVSGSAPNTADHSGVQEQASRPAVSVIDASVSKATPIPTGPAEVLFNYCTDCHDAGLKKGGINFDVRSVDWSSEANQQAWQKAMYVNDHLFMPPHGVDKPTAKERRILSDWIDQELSKQIEIGGTPPRRLNKTEYRNTIRSLFYIPDYELPQGFPGDTTVHGFNNVSEGLVLSATHMAAYNKVATDIADRLYPQLRLLPPSKLQAGGPDEMSLSFSASAKKDGKMRLASSSIAIMRSCAWPTRAAVKASGVYTVTVKASSFKPKKNTEPMVLSVFARDVDTPMRARTSRFRVLKELEVSPKGTTSVSFEAELYENQTLMFQWKNAELSHDHEKLPGMMRDWFERDPRFLAAWQRAVFPDGIKGKVRKTELRGLNGWRILHEGMQDPDLDMSQATLDAPMTKKLLELFGNRNYAVFNFADALAHYYFNYGPSLELQNFSIEGPSKLVDSPQEKADKLLADRLAGISRDKVDSDEAYARKMLGNFLPRAFRRPVDERTIASFLQIATDHWAEGHGFNEGMHLMLRNVLISPQFLYRSVRPGLLDDHDLAARLSYFLTQSPPDATLTRLANEGRLSKPHMLRKQAIRLLPSKIGGPTHPFVKDFTGQWLGTSLLPEIMPDPKFRFHTEDIQIATKEVELFFAEMLVKNRPMRDFIDPGFTYTAPYFAHRIYQMQQLKSWSADKKKSERIQRFEFPRGTRHGGLLGMSAIMMTTANGVDTQPVLRGVWVMENILGIHPPPPPEDVPALTPDTRGAQTPRDTLIKHTNNPDCYSCHQHIDPIGFVFENFDPVGKWREKWPGTKHKIDPTGVLTDGTKLKRVVDFKQWVVKNEDIFAKNVANKLMIYGTGRELNHAEQNELKTIVKNNVGGDEGFRELILDLVASETFRTK
ncbi:MAG: DUF1588 domain-containing protein [Phycisphaeraceae bacterium]|nr:DUF1588 domain-containing protein [Phycisphaeraceae bacterium]